jgi:hypothetical protein
MSSEIGVLPLSAPTSPAVGTADGSSTASAVGSASVVFSSGSGNWTVPTGVTSVQIEVWGAGGGGGCGGNGSGSNGASGGGGGGYCKKNALTVTPGQTISYVVGTGGTAGTSNGNGSTGGNSSAYSGAYVANGGVGGLDGEQNNTVATAGGTASGGDVNITGGSSTAVPSGNTGGAGGTGAGSGGAGGAGGAGTTGSPGTAPGGGGGGGGKTDLDGGAGANGRVSFTYSVTPAGSNIDPSGISSEEAFGTSSLLATIDSSGISSEEAFGTSSLLATIDSSGISSEEAFGTSSLLVTYSAVGTSDGESTAEAVGLSSFSVVGTADGESTAEAVGEEINVYESEGGEVVLSSESEFNYTVFFEQKIRWDTYSNFYVEKKFSWNTGDLVLKWYRVQGCCSSATKNENPSGGCDIINFQIEDPTCVGASSQQQFIQNIAANSLTDLCNQLTNSGLRWEICSIKKFSLPADLRGVDVDQCNTLTEVPFCEIPECIEFCMKTNSIIYIKARAWVEQVFVYESAGGEETLSSISEVTAPEDAIGFYESTGGEVVLSSESEFSSSWSNNLTISIKGFASVAFEEILFGESVAPEITQSTATVFTNCGLCDSMPLTLHLNHNLSKAGELVDYLKRNGQEIPSSIPMHYNSKLKSWLGHYHLFGIGESKNGQEKWNFLFSWSCDSNMGDNYWRFSSLITRTDLAEGTDYDTRLIIKFPPDQICSYSQNFSFNFTFDVNTFTKFVDNNFDLALNEIMLYDKIGMFKTKNWLKDPILRMVVSKSSKTIDTQYKDIAPIFPNKPILY